MYCWQIITHEYVSKEILIFGINFSLLEKNYRCFRYMCIVLHTQIYRDYGGSYRSLNLLTEDIRMYILGQFFLAHHQGLCKVLQLLASAVLLIINDLTPSPWLEPPTLGLQDCHSSYCARKMLSILALVEKSKIVETYF